MTAPYRPDSSAGGSVNTPSWHTSLAHHRPVEPVVATEGRATPRSPDIIGMGALNVDYIASATGLSDYAAEQVAESTSRFEWNNEGQAAGDYIDGVMNQLGAESLTAALGGSAWNTLFTLAAMETDVRLGYVGVLGREEAVGLSFAGQMDRLRIDRSHVFERRGERCGMCLSFIDDGERVLLTEPGANREMGLLLQENFDDVVTYLAAAKLVHVTSFLDDVTPEVVADLLEEATRRNHRLVVSIDPGHDWAMHPSEAVLRIIRLSRVLFLNYREFKALAGYRHGESDEVLGERVTARCADDSLVFVTKRYDLVEVFTRRGAESRAHRFVHEFSDPERGIEDATGAGDVFAASVLAALFSNLLQVELGSYLGLTLARHKMRHLAFSGHSRFPDLTRGFLQVKEKSAAPTGGNAVVLAHDGDPQWDVVEQFLGNAGVPAVVMSPHDEGLMPSSLMTQQLHRASFAICVLRPGESGSRPDDRLVHYVGFLQGRYGFSRVAVLAEEGTAEFSNISGLLRLDFRPRRVEQAFVELDRMLRREGVVVR